MRETVAVKYISSVSCLAVADTLLFLFYQLVSLPTVDPPRRGPHPRKFRANYDKKGTAKHKMYKTK